MALSTPKPSDAELADGVVAAVVALNVALTKAHDHGLTATLSAISSRKITDRFERLIYRAEVLRPLT